MDFSSLADLVKNYETGGQANPYTALNYAYDPTHTASGAYQITNTLWRQFAPGAGVDLAAYPSAASAPPASQDSVFGAIVGANGLSDWTCPGCNPALTSYLAKNPDAANLPVNSDGTGTAGASKSGGGSILNPSSWFTALSGWFAGIASRAVLFIVALLLLLGAFYLFGTGEVREA